MEDPEFDIVTAIAGGDEAAFEELVKRYQAPIITFIYRHLGDLYPAQDLVQEVFLRIFQAAPRFEPKAKVSSWVLKIAYNLSANEVKRRKRIADFHIRMSRGDLDILGKAAQKSSSGGRNQGKGGSVDGRSARAFRKPAGGLAPQG